MKDKLLNLFAEYLEKQDALSKLTDHEKLHEYGYSEIHVVAAIGDLQNPNVTSIAKHMKMTKGAVSKIIKRLLSADVRFFIPLQKKGDFYMTNIKNVTNFGCRETDAFWISIQKNNWNLYENLWWTSIYIYKNKSMKKEDKKMLVDITLKITPKMATDAQGNEKNL